MPLTIPDAAKLEPGDLIRYLGPGSWELEDTATLDDLRSRLACIAEATWWDRPYDERLATIRGMCDLTTDGMTPKP